MLLITLGPHAAREAAFLHVSLRKLENENEDENGRGI